MFSSSTRAGGNDSEFAQLQNTISGKLLTTRIALQQVIDEANKFPVLDSKSTLEDSNPFRDGLQSVLGDMVDLLQQQVPVQTEIGGSSCKKRPRTLAWEDVMAPQEQLQGQWESVMNREHARSHFGSEQKKKQLKVFNNSIWDQIDDILTDQNRVMEKSRVPIADSERKRIEGTSSDSDSDSEDEDEGGYDMEVYDDRHFYSQMLKSFISSSTGASSGGLTTSSMRAEDFAALKQYKKKKSKVDRKASKGRKIRYVPHEKLRNFMFPVPHAESAIDVDHLFNSLFQ